MRLVFMGSPPFAVAVFEQLLASSHRVSALVTRPDRPKGRGRKTEVSPLVAAAERASIEVLQPTSTRDAGFVESLRHAEPDVLLVASYGEILKRDVLELAPQGALNVHASLLPRHRGASPIQAAILAGDGETGVTIQRMVLALDEGDVLCSARLSIGDDENAGELLQRLAQLGGATAVHALDLLERGEAHFVPQDPRLATYARKLPKDAGWIDWSQPADEIARRVRAMTPWPGARTSIAGGGELTVSKARVFDGHGATALLGTLVTPGTVLDVRNAVVVSTGAGAIAIERVKPAGKADMDGAAWLRGAHLAAGSVLGSR